MIKFWKMFEIKFYLVKKLNFQEKKMQHVEMV